MGNERMKREVVENEEGEVRKIISEEAVEALKKMKEGKAIGPDHIPAELWKFLRQTGVEKLRHLFNGILKTENILDEWRCSTLVPICKNKGNIQDCENYRGIKLMSYTMESWERERWIGHRELRSAFPSNSLASCREEALLTQFLRYDN